MKKTIGWLELFETVLKGMKQLLRRFVKLPFVVKVIVVPITYLLFVLLFFPVVIVLGMVLKIVSAIKIIINWVVQNWKILFTFLKYVVFKLPIISIVILALLFIVTIYMKLTLPLFSETLLKILGCLLLPYLIFVQIMFSKSATDNLKIVIKDAELDVDALNGPENAGQNPFSRLLKFPFLLSLISSLNLIGSFFLIIIGFATLNGAFPYVFFKDLQEMTSPSIFWMKYMIDQLLIIIPIDLAGPFLPNKTNALILQPWGGVLSIIAQLFLTYMVYLSVGTNLLAARLGVVLKKKK